MKNNSKRKRDLRYTTPKTGLEIMSPDSDSAPAMPIDSALLEILCCPETKQAMTPLDAASLEILNRKIADGELQNKGGNLVKEPLDGGVIRSDKQVAYPIREMIPIMLIEEGIPLDGILQVMPDGTGASPAKGQACSCESEARSPRHNHHTERSNWTHT